MASIFRFICSILLLVLQVSAVAMPVVYGTDVGGEQYMCMYWQIAPYVEPKNMVSESIWDKRRAMCSNARCGFQKTCTLEDNVFTENTVLGKNYKFTFHIKVERRWPAKINNPGGFPDCYNSLEVIIRNCLYKGYSYGSYTKDNQVYIISVTNP